MKILMVLDHEFPPDPRVENEINSLTTSGHEVHLACYTRQNKIELENINNLTIYRKPISSFIYKSSVGVLKFPFYFNFWTTFLIEISKTQRFDAIHIHDLPLAKVGYTYSRKHNIPFVLDLHENWPSLVETWEHTNTFLGKLISSNNQWRKYEEEFCRKADFIITVVDEMKERVCKLGVSSKKVITLSNTFNLDNKFELKDNTDNNKLILFYAGGINKHRGLQTVLKGLKHVISHKNNIVLWIVGSGKYTSTLEKIVVDEGLSDYVKFYGQKPFKETMDLLSQSDITLIPHIKSEQTDNSSPNKLFQYMYFQKPVMVSNCRSLERIVDETSCGTVYQYDSPKSFAKALTIIIDSGLMEDYGKNGRSFVMNKYNWAKSAIPFLHMYNSMNNASR